MLQIIHLSISCVISQSLASTTLVKFFRLAHLTITCLFVSGRYVDLSEAIDSGDASFLDNTEYHETDAVPLNAALPTAHYLVDEVKREF